MSKAESARWAQKTAAKAKVVEAIKATYRPEMYQYTHLSPTKIDYLCKDYPWSWDPPCFYFATNFCRFLEPDNYRAKYMYGIVLKDGVQHTSLDRPSRNKILKITTIRDGETFAKLFGVKTNGHEYKYDINFDKVARLYGGIEWCGPGCTFFEWVVPGYGCLFNVELVQRLVMIARIRKKEWVVNTVQPVCITDKYGIHM
jgi:hypothetical protein